MTRTPMSGSETPRTLPSRARRGGGLAALVLVALAAPPATSQDAPAAPPAFRAVPIELRSADFVGSRRLRGEGYVVDGSASNDGWVNSYGVQTDWGRIQAVGTDTLLYRLHEIAALQKLEEMKRSKVMTDAVKSGVLAPAKGAVELVTSPVETTTGAVKGMGRWVTNIGRSAVSSDPHQEGVLSAVVSYDGRKRAFALQLGVDPWTSFEPVQERLDEIARASVAAGLATRVVMGAVTPDSDFGTAVTALGITSNMNKMLADNPAAVIRKLNQEKLEALGVPGHEAAALMRNFNYTPTDQSLLVAALESMGKTGGREIFVVHATAAPTPDIARFMVLRAQMMAKYIETSGKADIVDVAGYPWLRMGTGKVVGVLPVDYVAWTAELAAAEREASRAVEALPGGAPRGAPGSAGKALVLEGKLDPVARPILEARGWTVKENARLTPRGALSGG